MSGRLLDTRYFMPNSQYPLILSLSKHARDTSPKDYRHVP